MSRKEEYEWLKSRNICVSCRQAKATRGVKCDACADKDLERRHKKLALMTEEEKLSMRRKNKEYLQKRYAQRRKDGLCLVCGKPVYENHSRCYECYLKEARINREIWQGNKKGYAELGLCRICGKEVVKGKSYCKEHLKEQQDRMAYAQARRMERKI